MIRVINLINIKSTLIPIMDEYFFLCHNSVGRCNVNNLEKMIEIWKKISRDKLKQIQKNNKRKLGIKDRKRVVDNKANDDRYERYERL